jgi:hypothetical protein
MFSTAEPSDPLLQAAVFSGRAPSLHNSQPWHWRVGAGVLDLRLEPSRVLWVSDRTARLAVLSCGAALHHARIHLAATGWRVDVTRVPDRDDPDLLARLRLEGRAPADHAAIRLVQAAEHRRTDRHAITGFPVDLHRVSSIRNAVHTQGADLTPLRPHQVFEAPSFFRTAKPSRVVWNGEWLWLSIAGSSRPSLRTRL